MNQIEGATGAFERGPRPVPVVQRSEIPYAAFDLQRRNISAAPRSWRKAKTQETIGIVVPGLLAQDSRLTTTHHLTNHAI